MKLTLKLFLAITATLTLTNCTSSPEDQVHKALKAEFSKDSLVKATDKSATELLGSKESRFKTSLKNYVVEKTTFEFSDIKIEENKATATVTKTEPGDALGGLIFMAAFIPREKLEKMSLQEVFQEIAKNSREPASLEDIKSDVKTFTANLEKTGDEWKIVKTSKPKKVKK